MSGQAVQTLAHVVRRYAGETPDRAMLHIGDTAMSFAQVNHLADRVALSLRRDGVAAGDTIAVLAGNTAANVALIVGAARADAVLAAIPVSADAAAQEAMIRDSGARLLFADTAMTVDGVPTVEIAAGLGEWLGDTDGVAPDATVDPAGPTTIIYSSGTTGLPKGIVQPHGYRSRMLESGAARGFSPESVTLLATPLYSNTTLSSLVQTLGAGGSIALLAKFDAGIWLATASRLRATHAMLVPVMCQRLLAHPDFDRTDLTSFRMKYCTSAPFGAAAKREMLERWPGGLIEYYGMTEGGASFVLFAHEHPDKLHTVGRPAPGSEVRILDDEDRDVPPGMSGEIVGRSAGMMIGYHNQPGETAAIRWTAPDGSVWQRTGDIGQIDADGFLSIVDRKKDMIISGGFNIYPSDIEAVLADHPNVREASVVGVPSATWGETPVAFVVAPEETADGLREWLNGRLGKMQRVADVRLIDSLPRGPIGKVLKRQLRDEYAAA
jgi:acyl-CoA synthetase (AMP-forming)/AMP-acid ligase II